MTYRTVWFKRSLLILVLVMLGSLSVTSLVLASGGIFYGNGIPANAVVEKDAFLSGDTVVVAGDVDGDLFVVGTTVTIDGDVSGSLYLVADTVTLNAAVDGSVYAATMNFNQSETSTVAHSLYYIGTNLVTDAGASIGRDLNAYSAGAELNGVVARDLNATVGIIKITRKMLEAFDWETGKIRNQIFSGNAAAIPVTETETVWQVTPAGNQLVVNGPFGTRAAPAPLQDEPPTTTAPSQQWLVEQLRQLVMLLLVAALLLWGLSKPFGDWSAALQGKPLLAVGTGFVVYIVGFAGILLLMAMVVALGFFFHTAYLDELGWTVWWVGLSGLTFAMAIFLAFVNFVSKIIVGYWLGHLVVERLTPDLLRWRALPLILGLVIYTILRAIPVLGWVLGLIITFAGLGAVWLALRNGTASPQDAPNA